MSNMCSIVKMRDGASPEAVSLDELERQISELAAHIAVATCHWLCLVAEFDDRGGWAEWGVKSCAHWLSWRCSIALGAAREQVRVARRLQELPAVREAFSRGELSYCKVRAVTRVATAETEAGLVEIARHATGAQLEKLVRCYSKALSATVPVAQRAHELRYLKWSWNDDGTLRIEGRLPADDGALVVNALSAVEQQPAEEDGFAPSPVAACRADALVALARSALSTSSPHTAGADRCEIVVHVDAATLAADEVRDRCHLSDGPALAPETVRRLGCDASVVRIVERDGRPLTVGRRTRTIPPALRRALRSRDGGCRFPAARTSGSCTRITSGTGRGVGPQHWKIWFSCALTTIAWYTRAASGWSRLGGGRSGSDGQTGAWWRRRRSAEVRVGRRWVSSIERGASSWTRTPAGRSRLEIGWTTGWRWRCCCRGRLRAAEECGRRVARKRLR